MESRLHLKKRMNRNLLLLVILSSSITLAWVLATAGGISWDEKGNDWTRTLLGPRLETPLKTVSYLGSHVGAAASYILLLALAKRVSGWRLMTFVLIIALLELGLIEGTKEIFQRERPFDVGSGSSFPSGHVLHMIVFSTISLLVLTVRWKNPIFLFVVSGTFLLVTIAMAAARLYLGFHWGSDILGSFLIGASVSSLILGGWAFARTDLSNENQ